MPSEAFQTIRLGNRRIQSVDLLRGIVMIIMAIDHVRVFSGVLPGGPTAGVFFTRWITHFCAPAFTFLAGTSAFLYYQKSGDKKDLIKFLVSRGLLLVVLELTIVRFFWTFNFDYVAFVHTNIIWTLGWCMVILAAFVRLRPSTTGIIGLTIIFVQQLFQFVPIIFPLSLQESVANVWGFFYPSRWASTPGVNIIPGFALPTTWGISILYVIIPWIGVMMAGYGFGPILLQDFGVLKKISLRIGIASIVVFIAVATVMILVTKTPADIPFILKLLGQQKYPPTQLYLLMTLGPTIALIPWADKLSGKLSHGIRAIGRVPLFYYLLHLLVIHLSAFLVNLVASGSIHHGWYHTAPLVMVPESQRWGLPLLYLVWIIDVFMLYVACRWYAGFKSRNPGNIWLKYI